MEQEQKGLGLDWALGEKRGEEKESWGAGSG
jgi:hypothetical protein